MEDEVFVEKVLGSLIAENVNVKSDKPKKIIVNGLLLPKDKVSRNNVLYDWNSIKEKHMKLIGISMAYNHQIEGNELPVGHFTDSVLLESKPDSSSKWRKIWDITTEKNDGVEQPGWYYEADIRPGTEVADCILRGDLRKVSVQVMADKAVAERNEDTGDSYKRAFIGSIVEGSPVISPGFEQTTLEVALAEAFRVKESGQTTATNPGASTDLLDDEDEKEYIGSTSDYDNYSKWKYNKLYDDLTERQQRIIRTMVRKHGPFMVESFKDDTFGVFPVTEFTIRLAQRLDSLGDDKFNYDKVVKEAGDVISFLGEEPVLDEVFVERLIK